jgi:hypothetical protein
VVEKVSKFNAHVSHRRCKCYGTTIIGRGWLCFEPRRLVLTIPRPPALSVLSVNSPWPNIKASPACVVTASKSQASALLYCIFDFCQLQVVISNPTYPWRLTLERQRANNPSGLGANLIKAQASEPACRLTQHPSSLRHHLRHSDTTHTTASQHRLTPLFHRP